MLFVRRVDWATMSFSSRTRYRGRIQGGVCHWPGMNFTINSQQDEINLLNSILRSHRAGVYNDIAYNFAFGRFGHVYELRGAEYQSGAHSPLNGTHEAYLFLTSTNEQPPKRLLDTATAFILTRRSQGVGGDLKAHSDTKATQCPGDALRNYVKGFTGQPPKIKPGPKPKGVKVQEIKNYRIKIHCGPDGRGWTDIPNQRWGKDPVIVGYSINGPAPERDKTYWDWSPAIKIQPSQGGAIVSCTGAPANAIFDVWVTLGKV